MVSQQLVSQVITQGADIDCSTSKLWYDSNTLEGTRNAKLCQPGSDLSGLKDYGARYTEFLPEFNITNLTNLLVRFGALHCDHSQFAVTLTF